MSDTTNLTLFDGWSIGHLVAGFAGGVVGIRYPTFLALHVVYDLGEQVVERTELGNAIFQTSGPENLLNVTGDTALASFGWVLGRALRAL